MDIATRPTAPLREAEQTKRRRIWPAILTLYVLAAIIPECVATYNTTPRALLFNPTLFFFLTAFYGSANLLIRELIRRRRRRWACLLLLGAAFGFINEGIIAGTWYTVIPGGYAMIGGVDWAWAVALTAFHTLYSVVIPILLVEAIFPDLADRPWLKRRGLIGFSLLLALTTTLGLLAPAYRLDRFLVLLAVIVLTIIALRLPLVSKPGQQSAREAPRLGRLRVAGFGGTLLFFGAIIFVPALLAHTVAPTISHLPRRCISSAPWWPARFCSFSRVAGARVTAGATHKTWR